MPTCVGGSGSAGGCSGSPSASPESEPKPLGTSSAGLGRSARGGSVMSSELSMSELHRQKPHGSGDMRSATGRLVPSRPRHLPQMPGRLQLERKGWSMVSLCQSSWLGLGVGLG